MSMDSHILLALMAGALVGFTLALVGGGGSILAVPLLVYLVGIQNPHVAIGTSAVAVSVNAAINLWGRLPSGTVKWRCVAVFTGMGVTGALIGSWAGRAMNGQVLLSLFAVLMLVVAGLMFRARKSEGNPKVRLNRDNFPRLVVYGTGTGLLSGFFGIGGGFLIVPGLMAATAMPIVNAVSSSLFAVTAFGVTTSSGYVLTGQVNWIVATLFVAGGFAGGFVGTKTAARLAPHREGLTVFFAGLIVVVALYTLYRGVSVFMG